MQGPQASALAGVVEVEEMLILSGSKANHGIDLPLDYCCRMMLGESLTCVICLVLREKS